MESSTSDVPKEKENIIKKLWAFRKYINIEPYMFFYIMPSMLNSVAVQNFPLEKACRVNYNYSEVVCTTILDKDEFGIDCDSFDFENSTELGSGMLWNVTDLSPMFNFTVCKAERDAQKLSAQVTGIRAPIAAIFPFIVMLFAGGWSDKHNKRKPCMLVPLIGEGLSFFFLFISAIFFDSIPMEFGAYIEAIVPAMFGGLTFVLMAVYSFITAATPEPDRVFRFGIFAMFINCVPFIGIPFSGILFKELGYKWSFAMSWICQVIAFFYLVFFVDEAKAVKKATPAEVEGTDNPGFEIVEPSEANGNRAVMAALDEAISGDLDEKDSKPKSCLAEFFDPTLAIACLKLPLQKRPNYGQALLIALIIAYFLTAGPAAAEAEYWYRYTLIKLNWNGNQYSVYSTFSSAMAIAGTFIGTAILSKILKLSDSSIGILSAICIVISRPIFAFARDSIAFYIAGVVEMFVSLRVIAIKTIGSSIVEGDELSRMFAIFGISEPIAQFIFPPLYAYVYSQAVDHFPGAIFLFGELFFIPNVIVFIICYILLKKKLKKDVAIESGAQNGASKSKADENADPQTEITSL